MNNKLKQAAKGGVVGVVLGMPVFLLKPDIISAGIGFGYGILFSYLLWGLLDEREKPVKRTTKRTKKTPLNGIK